MGIKMRLRLVEEENKEGKKRGEKKGSNKILYLITVLLVMCLLLAVCLCICCISNKNAFMLPKKVDIYQKRQSKEKSMKTH